MRLSGQSCVFDASCWGRVRVWPEMGASLRWGDLCERVGAGTLQEKNAGVKPLC